MTVSVDVAKMVVAALAIVALVTGSFAVLAVAVLMTTFTLKVVLG